MAQQRLHVSRLISRTRSFSFHSKVYLGITVFYENAPLNLVGIDEVMLSHSNETITGAGCPGRGF
jgi:hypothetical protein